MKISTVSSAEELDRLFETSHRHPVWLFKHSLTCGISSSALREYQRAAAAVPEDRPVRFALLEIQPHRPLSDQVARRTGVVHQSPQALLLVDGEAVWNASHWQIQAADLERALAAAGLEPPAPVPS